MGVVKDAPFGLTLLAMGSLSFACVALMADTEVGRGALVRNNRLIPLERRILIGGLVASMVAASGIFVDAALGRNDIWVPGGFAVTMATATGTFALLVLLRADPIPRRSPAWHRGADDEE